MALQRWLDKKDIPKNLTPAQAAKWKQKVGKMLTQQVDGLKNDLEIECESLLSNTGGKLFDDNEWKETLKEWNSEIRVTFKQVILLRNQIDKNTKRK